ncbi:TRAP transporter large permease [Acuticoccus sp. M5D2P5]|uniref:TRAP transporter large permease n=1 Tax=Acuticoccus kalidii TaxID=2910977 RepID=UPI001F35AC66|nr:TRAP transporter large permease [Acuticoccus kalidii]MCF3933440.1 TRAP transporter large permease [Acuticoccus kalidii]
MTAFLALGGIFGFAIIGVPVAFILLGVASGMIWSLNLPLKSAMQHMVAGVDSFILIAVPCFVLAAKLMNAGRITDRIFDLAGAFVRHIKGGLAHVNILASLIFSGMSGSAVADAAGLGEIEVRAMRKAGFDAPFAAAVTAASSVIGPIFPPSVPFVIYAGLASVSVAKLFLAGAIPAILMALMLGIAAWVISVRRDYPTERRARLGELGRAFVRALFPLLSPIFVVGAIVFGITTPTEAAVIAVIYSLILGFAYRTIRLKDLPRILTETAVESGVLLFIVATVAVFSWTITFERIPQQVIEFVFSFSSSKEIVMLLVVAVMLLLGMFMNPTPGLLIATPFLLPLASVIGVDPIQLGVVMVLTLAIGLVTPPIGICLFIVCRVARVDVGAVVRETIPFVIALALVAVLVAMVPALTLWLPNLMFSR